jgi:ParB/RepB/Spo0J family partition protein
LVVKKNEVCTIGIRKIEKSMDLVIGVPQKDIDKYSKVVSAFGNVAPAIVAAHGDMYCLIDGQARLEAYARAGINDIPAVVAHTDGEAEQLKLSLLLSASREQGGALSEGAIIEKLVKNHGYALGEISHIVGRSKAWLSKRQTMARNLTQPLKDMIVSGAVCTRAAEEISKLPQDEQAVFAANVVKEALNKDDIHRLVKLYRSPEATLDLCRAVIESPSEALLACPKVEKPRTAYAKNDTGVRLHRTAYYAINLLEGLGKMICTADEAALGGAIEHLLKLNRKMMMVSKLISTNLSQIVSPGKLEGYEND